MDLRVAMHAESASRAAADWIGERVHRAVDSRGLCTLALSGGKTPRRMLRALAAKDLPWNVLHVFQVDERVAPPEDASRNFTHLNRLLLQQVGIPARQVHAMPVELPDLHRAARRYASELAATAGRPPILDIVHLGLGADGHTASLVPGDPVLKETVRDVAETKEYAGRQRLTLTFPCLARSRNRVWLVTGASKSVALAQWLQEDAFLPVSQLTEHGGGIFADRAAAAGLPDTGQQIATSDQ